MSRNLTNSGESSKGFNFEEGPMAFVPLGKKTNRTIGSLVHPGSPSLGNYAQVCIPFPIHLLKEKKLGENMMSSSSIFADPLFCGILSCCLSDCKQSAISPAATVFYVVISFVMSFLDQSVRRLCLQF